MSDPYKLTVKIGDAEFSAEGDPKAVHDQYQLFLTALKYAPSDAHKSSGIPVEPKHHTEEEKKRAAAAALPQQEPADVTMQRIFKVDHADIVSLQALPADGDNINADALVMLLYGFLKLTQSSTVSALMLMRGAQQSGLGISRIDRIISVNKEYITIAGAKRGTKYGLNNRGVQHAISLITKVLS